MRLECRLLFAQQVPEEALETMVQDGRGLRWSPNVVFLGGPIEGAAEESVKPANVVHVQMREEQVVNGLDLTEGLHQRQCQIGLLCVPSPGERFPRTRPLGNGAITCQVFAPGHFRPGPP